MKHIKIIFRKLSVKYIVILLSVAILPNCSNLNEMKITQSERKHYQNPEISCHMVNFSTKSEKILI